MKKRIADVIIVALVIVQVCSWVRISALEDRLKHVDNMVQYNAEYLEEKINSRSQKVEQKLEEQASLILDASMEVGKMNASTCKVPVTFMIQPKVVTEAMSVVLDFNGEILQLNKAGLQYSQSKEFEITDNIDLNIIIEDNGVKNIEEYPALNGRSIVDEILPIMCAYFDGGATYSSKECCVKGQLDIDYKPSKIENPFVDIRCVIKVDDEIIQETPVSMTEENGTSYMLELDDTYAISKGQVLTMNMIAVDSLGCTYEYQVMYFVAGEHAQRAPYCEQISVTAPNGQVIYQPDDGNDEIIR